MDDNDSLTKEIDYMSEVISERDKAINEINLDIICIKEIYGELANLVNEQGENIDNICQNLEASSQKTKKGLEEIKGAEKNQSRCSIQ